MNATLHSDPRAGLFAAARRIAAIAAAVLLICTPGGVSAQDAPTDTDGAANSLAVPANRQADNVAVITIQGPIDQWTAVSFRRRLAEAESSGADALVIDIDTPGGELGAVLEISGLIKQSPIANTTAWINPEAYSGGAIIAVACRRIVLAPSARFGDALIIQVGPGTAQALPEELRPKMLSPLLADVVDSARRNGYDEYVVQGFVTLGVELWLVRDTRTGRVLAVNEAEYNVLFDTDPPRTGAIVPSIGDNVLADIEAERALINEQGGIGPPAPREDDEPEAPTAEGDPSFKPASPSTSDLADSIDLTLNEPTARPQITPADRGSYEFVRYVMDGKGPLVLSNETAPLLGFSDTTIADDEELAAYFDAKDIKRQDMAWSEKFARLLTSIPVRGLLVAVLLVCVFLSLTAASTSAGGVAMLCLFALIAPPYMVGMAGWWEVTAIVGGIAFIAIEIFVVPGFGVFGILGLIALFGGLVGTFVRDSGGLFPNPEAQQKDLLYGAVTVMLSTVSSGVGIYFLAKNFGSLPVISRIILKDEPGPEDPDPLFSLAAAEHEAVSVGDRGVATTPLRPSGRARFGEEGSDDERVIDVAAGRGWFDTGDAVEIVAIEGMRIVVEAPQDKSPEAQPGDTV